MTSLVDAHVSHKSKDVNVTRAHRSTSDSPTVRNVSVTLTPKHVTQRLGIVQTVDTIPLAQNVIPVLLDTMVMLHKVCIYLFVIYFNPGYNKSILFLYPRMLCPYVLMSLSLCPFTCKYNRSQTHDMHCI